MTLFFVAAADAAASDFFFLRRREHRCGKKVPSRTQLDGTILAVVAVIAWCFFFFDTDRFIARKMLSAGAHADAKKWKNPTSVE